MKKKVTLVIIIIILMTLGFSGCLGGGGDSDPELINLKITNNKNIYYTGEEINLSELIVKGIYSDDSEKTLEILKDNIINFDSNIEGTKTITVKYGEKTAHFEIQVNKNTIKEIRVLKKPTKLVYKTTEDLKLNGMEVEVEYVNGKIENKEIKVENITGYDPNTPGKQNLILEIEGKVTNFEITVEERSIVSIELKRKPFKLKYIKGEELDLTGIEIEALFDTWTKEKIEIEKQNVISFENVTDIAGKDIPVRVNINNKLISFKIEVVGVSSLYINTQPSKANYFIGEKLDLTGATVKIYYTDYTDITKQLKEEEVFGFDSNTAGYKTVLVSIGGQMTNFKLNVVELSSIQIINEPIKSKYYIGESFDINGLTANLNYTNGSTKTKTVEKEEISGFDSSTAGTKKILVNISGRTATFEVEVSNVELEELIVENLPNKTVYLINEEFILEGLKIVGKYSDNNQRELEIKENQIFGYDSSVAGVKIIEARVGIKKTNFAITIKEFDEKEMELNEIKIIKNPSKTSYVTGDSLNLSGLEIMGIYSDGEKEIERLIAVTSSNIMGFDNTKEERQTIIVSISGKECTFEIEVIKAGLESLNIISKPYKLEYYQEEDLKISGLVVEGTYSDGSKKTEFITSSDVLGFDSEKIGEQVLTIKKGTATADQFLVSVIKKELVSMMIESNPTINSYAKSEKLNLNGLLVRGYYNNNTSKIMEISEEDLIGYDSNVAGSQKITIKIGDITTSFNVWVRELNSISIQNYPLKTNYELNEKLDLTGLSINMYYSDGSNMTRAVEKEEVSGFESIIAGTKKILINIAGRTSNFDIEVKTTNKATLSSISIVNVENYSYKKYKLNSDEELIIEGMILKGLYTDYSEKIFTINKSGDNYLAKSNEVIKVAEVSGFDTKKGIGYQTITVKIDDKIIIFTIEIVGLSSIRVNTQPNKTNYKLNEELDLTGLTINLYYSDSSNITRTIEKAEVSGFDSNTAGDKTLTITVGEFKTYLNVYVFSPNERVITYLDIKDPNKTLYKLNEELDVSGMYITVYYSNSDEEIWKVIEKDGKYYGTYKEDEKEVTIDFDNSTAGTKQTITIFLDRKTSFFTTITEKVLSDIQIESNPKTNYSKNEELVIEGMKLKGYYKEGSDNYEVIYNVSKKEDGYIATGTYEGIKEVFPVEVSGFDSSIAGTKTVSIIINNIIRKFTINIIGINYIYVNSENVKKDYYKKVNEELELDLRNLLVTAYYTDGTEDLIDNNLLEVKGFDKNTEGKQTIIIGFGGSEKSFEINIYKLEAVSLSIDISSPVRTGYFLGEELDLTGLKVKIKYNDGSSKYATYYKTSEITTELLIKEENNEAFIIRKSNVNGFDKNLTGSQTLKIILLIEGKTLETTFEVEVNNAKLESIEITKIPNKTLYVEGDNFLSDGMEIIATYETGEKKTVSASEINNYRSNETIKQTIEVIYREGSVELSKTFEIEVVKLNLVELEILEYPREVYYLNEEFEYENLKVKGIYNNGTITENLKIYETNIEGFISNQTVDKMITLSKDGVEVITDENGKITEYKAKKIILELKIKVLNPYVENLIIKSAPKTNYYVGDELDLTGVVVRAMKNTGVYSDYFQGDINLETEVSYNKNREGSQNAMIFKNGKWIALNLNYQKIELESLQIIKSEGFKEEYLINDKFTHLGMTIVAHYNNGDIKELSQNKYVISELNTLVAKDNIKLIISYTEDYTTRETFIEVDVKENDIVDITNVTLPNKLEYYAGEEMDITGFSATMVYRDGHTEAFTWNNADPKMRIYAEEFTGLDYKFEGQEKIIFKKGEAEESFNITMKPITKLEVTNAKYKYYFTDYYKLYNYDLEVTATYSDNTKKIFKWNDPKQQDYFKFTNEDKLMFEGEDIEVTTPALEQKVDIEMFEETTSYNFKVLYPVKVTEKDAPGIRGYGDDHPELNPEEFILEIQFNDDSKDLAKVNQVIPEVGDWTNGPYKWYNAARYRGTRKVYIFFMGYGLEKTLVAEHEITID